MKKQILLFAAAVLCLSNVHAYTGLTFDNEFSKNTKNLFAHPSTKQSAPSLFLKGKGGDAFAQGKFVVSLGYGFPNLGKAVLNALISDSAVNVTSTGIGPIHLRAEYALSDGVGFGVSVNYISCGVKFTDLPYDYTWSRSSLSILARLNFHFATSDQIDPYFGIGAGYRQATWKFSSTDPAYSGEKIPGFSPFGFETTIGMRYYFTDGFGMYTELGIAKSVIQAGIVASF